MSYERLIAEHARIDTLCDSLMALVDTDTPDVAATVIMLSDLSIELGEHLAHEDCMIYPRMLNAQNPEIRDIAIAFTSEFASLRVDWGCIWASGMPNASRRTGQPSAPPPSR